jgi:hypothetical protein
MSTIIKIIYENFYFKREYSNLSKKIIELFDLWCMNLVPKLELIEMEILNNEFIKNEKLGRKENNFRDNKTIYDNDFIKFVEMLSNTKKNLNLKRIDSFFFIFLLKKKKR